MFGRRWLIVSNQLAETLMPSLAGVKCLHSAILHISGLQVAEL